MRVVVLMIEIITLSDNCPTYVMVPVGSCPRGICPGGSCGRGTEYCFQQILTENLYFPFPETPF